METGDFAWPFLFISQERWKALFFSPQEWLYFHQALIFVAIYLFSPFLPQKYLFPKNLHPPSEYSNVRGPLRNAEQFIKYALSCYIHHKQGRPKKCYKSNSGIVLTLLFTQSTNGTSRPQGRGKRYK